ncbi:hypothetical protein DCO56_11005 [Sphingobacterium athyrii]|uniref:Uncharacterized protein n=1 Tax=Sphingobacterium athyrii TaxID=2152717 RepID=A0A363NT26_9SPHI|nr:hypothetical protein [Sphingobacterium sp. UBA7625]PUV23907.1 hypothetical protein DCO56_11005 [Sphingobacterium athyrii]
MSRWAFVCSSKWITLHLITNWQKWQFPRKHKVGTILGRAIIEEAKTLGAAKLYLENQRCKIQVVLDLRNS